MQLNSEITSSIPFQYAYAVQRGEIVCGRYIKLAVDRFFKWVSEMDEDHYYLNHSKGMHIIWFYENCLVHTVGKSAGQPFVLSPFQQFTLYNLFAWVSTDEYGEEVRRIRNVYEKVAKKNGKTAGMAGMGEYVMAFDEEEGAQVYIGATKEEQAKLCFNQAKQFVQKSNILQALGFEAQAKEIKMHRTNSFMKPLGGDSKTQDGINSHLTIIDEYHAHPDDTVKENLESSSAARRQPITYTITTAGFNVHGVCKQFEDVCISILEGHNEDDTFFIMIHDLDEGDDWEDPENWIKANPNLGVTVSMDFLLKEYQKAKNQPSKIPNFKTKHLNLWVDSPNVWIEAKAWDKCNAPINMMNLMKNGSTGGLDLSTTTDLTAYATISEPDEDGIRDLEVICFCPSDTIDKRSKEDKVPYRYWADNGWLIATPGNVIDYNVVEEVVAKRYYQYKTKWIEYDRKFSGSLIQRFQDQNIEVSPFSQTITEFSHPTKEFERLVLSGKIRHGGNPILKWMLSGCVAISDTNENIRISKQHSTKRIDGIIASIMALGGAETPEDNSNKSKYNDPNVEIYF